MSFKYLDKIGKVLCIGRNYAAHIKELNNATPDEPFFFLKPQSSILPSASKKPILIPNKVTVHHEIELGVLLNKDLRNLTMETFSDQDAVDAIDGYVLALDLTARNVQNVAKAKGLPWTIGKGFDTFLPLSPYISKSQIADPYKATLTCSVNGQVKQHDKTDLMLFNLRKIFVYMSAIMTLQKGDLILTGTPKGVGPIVPGDKISGAIEYDGKVVPESVMEFDVVSSDSPYIFQE